jgi:L-ribulose-5-phosphate 3-epimerase
MSVKVFRAIVAGILSLAGMGLVYGSGLKPAAVKLGVCDWTAGKSGDPGAFEVAARAGLAGVQVSLNTRDGALVLGQPAARQAFLEASKRSGVAIASFAIGELNDTALKSDPRAEKWLEEGIAIAQDMGIPIILVPFFGNGDIKDDPAGTAVVVGALRRLAPKAEKAGVILGLENQLSAAENIKIIESIGSCAVRVYYDVANSQANGYDVVREIHLLRGLICEIHAKDIKDLYGKGSMDFPAVRRAMDDIGYQGWLIIEGTRMPLGIEKSLRFDADYLKSVFGSR